MDEEDAEDYERLQQAARNVRQVLCMDWQDIEAFRKAVSDAIQPARGLI